jgi:hypothetical protein
VVLCLVGPVFEQGGGRYVVLLVAECRRLAYFLAESPVVLQQLRQHVAWRDFGGIVVRNAL